MTGDVVTEARYNYDGSRLVCTPSTSDYITVHDLLPNRKMDGTDKVSLGQGYNTTTSPRFAGKEDELLVSSSDNQLLVWHLPPGGRGHRTVESPLLELSGHQNEIRAFCFSKNIGALASGDANGVIKLWVPITKQTNN